MIGGFRLFGSRPKSQKMATDIEKFTQEEKEKMLERLNTLREKQREATRIITENANIGKFKDTSHIFSKEDRAELDKLNSQIGGKRRRRAQRRTQRRKARKANKTNKRNTRKSRKSRKVRKTQRRRR